VKDALSALVSAQEEFEIAMPSLPEPVRLICEERRPQAKKFTNEFYARVVTHQPPVPHKKLDSPTIAPDSIMASWPLISMVFHFFKTVVLNAEESPDEGREIYNKIPDYLKKHLCSASDEN